MYLSGALLFVLANLSFGHEISDRGTSWIGPLMFGVVVSLTNSYRQAILSLIVLFVVGMLILVVTDTEKVVRQAEARSL